jgi:hypothetical protein
MWSPCPEKQERRPASQEGDYGRRFSEWRANTKYVRLVIINPRKKHGLLRLRKGSITPTYAVKGSKHYTSLRKQVIAQIRLSTHYTSRLCNIHLLNGFQMGKFSVFLNCLK